MEELLSLKWNNHRTTFLHILAVLRDKQLYTDATLACDGKIYPVHKLVLSTCSDYFSAMLDRTSCKNPIIVLKDIKSEDLEALLDYMYLGEVNVRQSDLSTLIKAAECLRVKGLAVADDEPPPRKSRTSENQTRRGDTSGSPPAKRKRRSDVDDGRDDVRPSRLENRHSSPVHNSTLSRPKTPVNSHSSSTSLRNISTNSHSNTTVNNTSVTSISNSTSNLKAVSDGSSATNANSDVLEAVPCVKVEMEEDEHDVISGGGGDGSNALADNAGDSNTGDMGDNFNLSSEDFKEEDDNDGGDLGSDLPEFLQQATANYSHSSFAGTSFQPDLSWQGSGDSGGAGGGLAGNFGGAAGLSFGSSQQQDGTSHGSTAGTAKQLHQHHLEARHQRPQGNNRPHHSAHTKTPHYATSRTPRPKLEKPFRDADVVHLDNPFNCNPVTSPRQRQFSSSAYALANTNYFPSGSSPNEHQPLVDVRDGDLVLSPQQQDGYAVVYCPVCGRGFKGSYGKYNLKKHFLVHQGDKPFKCPHCQYSTIQKAHLKRHLEAIHSTTFELACGGRGGQADTSHDFGCASETGDLASNASDVGIDLGAVCGAPDSHRAATGGTTGSDGPSGDAYGADCAQYIEDVHGTALAGDCKPEDEADASRARKELY